MTKQILNELKNGVTFERAAEFVSTAVQELDDNIVHDIKNGTAVERATAVVKAARELDDRAKDKLGFRPSARILMALLV